MKYLVYDIESTGLDITKSEILELCVIDYETDEVLLHNYVYPDYETINNSHIHGIDLEKIKSNNGISQEDLINNLLNLFNKKNKYLMIAHNNNGYDQLLLEYSLKRKDKKIPKNVYFSDSLIMMRELFPNGGCYKLGAIYKAFFDNDDNVNFHCGIDDTKALLKILKKVESLRPNFKKFMESIKRTAFSNNDIKYLSYKLLYGLENTDHKVIKTIYDLFDIYTLLDKIQLISILREDFKLRSKYKINKIIEQLNLLNE